MNQTLQLGAMLLVLGLALGSGGVVGYQRYRGEHSVTSPVEGTRTPPDDGLKAVVVSEEGLNLRVRPTDSVGRLTDDANEVIGVRIFDPLNGEIADAPHVDVVWTRQAAFQDLPNATSLNQFKDQGGDDFKVEQSKELTIAGRPAVKQLYTAQVEVSGPFGTTQKQPLPGLRWVIDRGDGEFLILRSTPAAQKYLDLVATNLTFGEKRAAPVGGSVEQDVRSADLQDTVKFEGSDASPKQGSSELDVVNPDTGGVELKLE